MNWIYSILLYFFNVGIIFYYFKVPKDTKVILIVSLLNLFVFTVSFLSYVVLEKEIVDEKLFYFFGISNDLLSLSHFVFLSALSLINVGYLIVDKFVVCKVNSNVSKYVDEKIVGMLSIPFSILGCCLFVIAIGPGDLLSRVEYLSVKNQVAFTIGQFLTLAGVFLIGATPKDKNIYIQYSLIVISFLITFSLATRIFAIIPIAYYVGCLIRTNVLSVKSLALVFFLTIILLPIPLMLRDQQTHGLIEYAVFLSSLGFFDFFHNILFGLHNIGLNVSFGVPLTGIVISEYNMTLRDFYISINPLPGTIAGWYEIADGMRVSMVIPYNLYGEIWSLGWINGAFIFCLLGAGFRVAQYYIEDMNTVVKVFAVTFIVLFCIIATQYNTRSSVRMLYYLAFIVVLSKFFSVFKFKRS